MPVKGGLWSFPAKGKERKTDFLEDKSIYHWQLIFLVLLFLPLSPSWFTPFPSTFQRAKEALQLAAKVRWIQNVPAAPPSLQPQRGFIANFRSHWSKEEKGSARTFHIGSCFIWYPH